MNSLLAYLQYRLKAKNLHGVHSPFVYQLQEKVLNDRYHFKDYDEVESMKQSLKQRTDVVNFYDHGAVKGEKQVRINKLAANSGIHQKYGRLLYRLARWFQPMHVLELGTSLGIGTAYIAKGCGTEASIITLEGADSIAAIAQKNFEQINLSKQVNIIAGPIESNLEQVIRDLPTLDFVYFDANHRLVPTLQYFETCLKKAHENSVFIFDDINWSKEMRAAWAIIQKHPQVTVTLDLYRFGIVFFRSNQAKENFILKF